MRFLYEGRNFLAPSCKRGVRQTSAGLLLFELHLTSVLLNVDLEVELWLLLEAHGASST